MYANDKGAKIPLKFKIHLEFENIRLSVWGMCVSKSTLHTYVKEIPENGMKLLGT